MYCQKLYLVSWLGNMCDAEGFLYTPPMVIYDGEMTWSRVLLLELFAFGKNINFSSWLITGTEVSPVISLVKSRRQDPSQIKPAHVILVLYYTLINTSSTLFQSWSHDSFSNGKFHKSTAKWILIIAVHNIRGLYWASKHSPEAEVTKDKLAESAALMQKTKDTCICN